MTLEWKDPGPDPRSHTNWAEIAGELRAHPGQWALIGHNLATSRAMSIRRGQPAAFKPAGSFEAVTRNQEGGKCDLYARYIGDPTVWSSATAHGEYMGIDS